MEPALRPGVTSTPLQSKTSHCGCYRNLSFSRSILTASSACSRATVLWRILSRSNDIMWRRSCARRRSSHSLRNCASFAYNTMATTNAYGPNDTLKNKRKSYKRYYLNTVQLSTKRLQNIQRTRNFCRNPTAFLGMLELPSMTKCGSLMKQNFQMFLAHICHSHIKWRVSYKISSIWHAPKTCCYYICKTNRINETKWRRQKSSFLNAWKITKAATNK